MTPVQREWLLIFYALPSKPVGNRIKIWRKMAKAGAVQLKGAVYVLPATEEHYEFFQWLISEVTAMGGDGAFVKVPAVETMKDSEIIALFNEARERDYRELEKKLDFFERKVQSVRKGTGTQNVKALLEQASRLAREYEGVHTVDFFSSKAGEALGKQLRTLETDIRNLSGVPPKEPPGPILAKRPDAYQGRTWVTRKRPFVDRMASAWLIRRFIDEKALFRFIDEPDLAGIGNESVAFDIRGGEFTHQGDLCTFEVLMKTFGIKDRAVRKIAEIVHDLDIKDDKYGSTDAKGVEEILTGIRKTAKSDDEALERGMAVFEMLYVSKS